MVLILWGCELDQFIRSIKLEKELNYDWRQGRQFIQFISGLPYTNFSVVVLHQVCSHHFYTMAVDKRGYTTVLLGQ